MKAVILNSAIINSTILDSTYLSISSQTHSHLLRLVPTICTKNLYSFIWLNLMNAVIWNSANLDPDTAMLDSDTLLSSLRFPQKHSHSTLTLNQTNSIWLKLIHSHLTWWWQPSWILPSWIWPSYIQPSSFFFSKSLTLAKIGSHHLHKKPHSFILTQLDDGSHVEFCHVGFSYCHLGFRHLVIFSQIHSKTLSLHSDSYSN